MSVAGSGVRVSWARWTGWTSRPEAIQIVAFDLDVQPPILSELAALLSPDERDRAARYRFERDRRRFVAARGGLRSILGARLGEEPARIAFVYGSHGKPALAAAGLCFNVAHSDALGLVALTWGCEVGVDVERLRPLRDAAAIARRFFSAREVATLLGLPEEDREKAFFDCWTRKEAFLKATGEGLARPLDGFDVSLRPGEPARIEGVQGAPGEAGHWSLESLAPAAGYAAALALRRPIEELSCGWWMMGDDRWVAPAVSGQEEGNLEAR